MCVAKHGYLSFIVFFVNLADSSPFQGYMFGVYPPGIVDRSMIRSTRSPDSDGKIQLNFQKRSEGEDLEVRSGENGDELDYPDLYDPAGRTHRGKMFEFVSDPNSDRLEENDDGIFVNEMDEARRAPSYATQAELDELNDLQRKFKKQMNKIHNYFTKNRRQRRNVENGFSTSKLNILDGARLHQFGRK